jgi:hypothetical protein
MTVNRAGVLLMVNKDRYRRFAKTEILMTFKGDDILLMVNGYDILLMVNQN